MVDREIESILTLSANHEEVTVNYLLIAVVASENGSTALYSTD